MLPNNWLSLAITLILSLIWLRANDYAAHRGIVSSRLSRKIIHIGTGPLFVLCWLLFNNQPEARFLAALVPLGITVQFFLVGIGVIRDPSAIEAMSRSGQRAEILRGPLYYGIVFVLLTLIFWKTSPIGLIALMLLCGGDGLADVVGNRVRSACLPWSPDKSWAGSLAMFAGGFIFSLVIVAIFVTAGVFSIGLIHFVIPILIISLAGTIVESLPLHDLDNLTVPVTAVLLGLAIF